MFLTIKLCTHAKLNCLKSNYLQKDGFGVKSPTKPTNQPNVFPTKLFEESKPH